jgi:hypothetical protein
MNRTLLLLAVVACGSPAPINGPRAGQAVVYVSSNVRDAQVYVDGRFVGNLGLLHGGLAMDPGHHRVELDHAEYYSRYVELALQRGERSKLDLEMKPVLP